MIGQGQVLRIKPHLIVNPEYLLDDVWGLRCLVDRCCSLRPFLFEKAQAILDHFVWGVDQSPWVKVRMEPEQGFIGGHPQGGIGAVIMNSGGDCEPLIPIILLSCCKETEVLLYPLVLSFRQPVCLGVEHGGQILHYSELCGEGLAEMRREAWVAV